MLEVRCFETFHALGGHRGAINALNRESARPDPFSTFEFMESFHRHDELRAGRGGLPLWLLAVFERDLLQGFVALQGRITRVLGLPQRTLGFLVTRDTDRPHVLARPERLADVSAAVWQYLLERGAEWQVLELYQQDLAMLPLCGTLPSLPARYILREWPSLANATIHLRWRTLDDYAASLVRKFRVNLGRQMRNLAAAGHVEIIASSDAAATPAMLDLCCQIEQRSWKARAMATIGRHPDRRRYFEALLDPSQPMRISIQLLLLDGLPIAGLMVGSFGGNLYALHVVYDERYGRFAPGSAMLLLGVRQALMQGCTQLNLLSGFGYFKSRWLAQMTETRIIQVYRREGLLFARRWLGDLLRRVGESGRLQPLRHFNPLRRQLQALPAEEGEVPAVPDASQSAPGERRDIENRLAAIRACSCDTMGPEQFAATMSFGARKPGSAAAS
jgi:hypothetical protein